MASSPDRRQPYPSDLSDEQWELIAALVSMRSERGRGSKGGRPATYDVRDIVDAILYVNRTGCSWRQLPHDFPPWSGVFFHFQRWAGDGTVERVLAALRDAARDRDGRDPMASAGAIDSQSVPGAATVAGTERGYDAGKKVNGRKRHVVVDTTGLLIAVMVTAASVQDRDSVAVIDQAKMAMPSLALLFADGGYSRRIREAAWRWMRITVQTVAKPAEQRGFAVLPRRWVVERTHSWISGHRRLDHDYERRPQHSEALIKWAMIGVMVRRLAPSGRRPWS